MIVRPIVSCSMTPDAGMLFGNRGNQAIVDSINSRWSATGVIFGSESDPFANRFADFNRAFINVARDTVDLLNETYSFIMDRNIIVPINTHKSLMAVPVCMQRNILTYEPIRAMFNNDLIHGWGVNPDSLPDEDVVGRMLNIGYMGPDPITGIVPDEAVWIWKSTDPSYSREELEDLAEARGYIDTYIAEQLETDGGLLDPTSNLDSYIGKIR